jgi:hypothetical protein
MVELTLHVELGYSEEGGCAEVLLEDAEEDDGEGGEKCVEDC